MGNRHGLVVNTARRPSSTAKTRSHTLTPITTSPLSGTGPSRKKRPRNLRQQSAPPSRARRRWPMDETDFCCAQGGLEPASPFPKAVVHRLYIHLGRPSAFGVAQGRITVDIGEEWGVRLSPGYRMAMMSGSVRCESSSSLGSTKTGGRRGDRISDVRIAQ